MFEKYNAEELAKMDAKEREYAEQINDLIGMDAEFAEMRAKGDKPSLIYHEIMLALNNLVDRVQKYMADWQAHKI